MPRTLLGEPISRLRDYNGHGARVIGIDVARGLAVIGMLGAHVLITEAWDWGDSTTWLDVVNGRSAILFAILAGFSLAIISGRSRPATGVDLLSVRLKIFARAAGVFVIGGALEAMATGFPIILGTYAVVFVGALAVLSWSTRRLIVGGILILMISPLIAEAIRSARDAQSDGQLTGYFVDLMATGEFAAIFWVGFVFIGLGLGRLRLQSPRTQLTFVGVGAVTALVGYQISDTAVRIIGSSALEPDVAETLYGLVEATPHAGTFTEALGGGGIAVAIIGVSLLLARARSLRWVLFPVAAVGSMALTAYVGHFVAIVLLGEWAEYTTDPSVFAIMTLWMLGLCALWWILLGKGPLEQLLASLSRAATRTESARLSPEHSAQPTPREAEPAN